MLFPSQILDLPSKVKIMCNLYLIHIDYKIYLNK